MHQHELVYPVDDNIVPIKKRTDAARFGAHFLLNLLSELCAPPKHLAPPL